MAFDPFIPLAWWLSLAVVAAGAIAAYAYAGRRRLPPRRWWTIVALMSVAVSVPLVLLLNPTWIERLPPPAGKPRLTVLVDRSASMKVADVAGGPTRFQAASKVADSVAATLKDRFDVNITTFADVSTAAAASGLANVSPDGMATNIAAAIEDSLQDRPEGQAILLLSDGADNSEEGPRRLASAADKARAMAVPIFTRTIGAAGNVSDLEVAIDSPQELAFVSQHVPVTVRIKQRGGRASQTKLSLRVDDKEIESRTVRLTPDGDATATFQITQDRTGLYRYRFQAEPFAGEDTPLNNQATLLLRVIDEPLRVLLLEGKPYWDTKFLIRTLAADPSIELVSMVRLAEGRVLERKISRLKPSAAPVPPATGKAMQTAADPKADLAKHAMADEWRIHPDARSVLADPANLAKYQIVVLGRDSDLFLTDDTVGQLKKWLVDGDGSLVCFRGPPAAQMSRRLGELMPLKWSATREQRFRVKLTDRGSALKWLPTGDSGEAASLSGLPSLVSVNQVDQTMPLAEVFAQGLGSGGSEGRPVIAYQPVGNGRVVVIEGAGMWRWAFLPPEFQGRDNVYGTLWRSLMRWLVSQVSLLPTQQFALRSDKVSYSTGEPIGLTVLTRAEQGSKAPEVELLTEGQKQPRLVSAVASAQTIGQYSVPLGRLPEGEYRARIVGAPPQESAAATAFDVRGNLTERLDVAARPDVMRFLAERTGGAADAGDPAELARRLDQHLAATRPERSIRLTAWDRWWVLAGVMAVWAAAWGVRRASGLV
ncbi:MAG: hypothetical protein K8T25_12255 [Planctomycetia bacterium]|nr:hypothetical protein [Planctomycetia bacterium]